MPCGTFASRRGSDEVELRPEIEPWANGRSGSARQPIPWRE
jgi:hypothetical protein